MRGPLSQIFMFVFVRARLRNPLLVKHLLFNFCHESLLQARLPPHCVVLTRVCACVSV